MPRSKEADQRIYVIRKEVGRLLGDTRGVGAVAERLVRDTSRRLYAVMRPADHALLDDKRLPEWLDGAFVRAAHEQPGVKLARPEPAAPEPAAVPEPVAPEPAAVPEAAEEPVVKPWDRRTFDRGFDRWFSDYQHDPDVRAQACVPVGEAVTRPRLRHLYWKLWKEQSVSVQARYCSLGRATLGFTRDAAGRFQRLPSTPAHMDELPIGAFSAAPPAKQKPKYENRTS